MPAHKKRSRRWPAASAHLRGGTESRPACGQKQAPGTQMRWMCSAPDSIGALFTCPCQERATCQTAPKTLPTIWRMKTTYYTATSLDGFLATEDDSLDWLFSLGELNESSYPEFISGVGALAMGSATYEWMQRNADKVAAETGSPWPYTQPTWVFTSRTLPAIDGANIQFASGDVRTVHAAMRAAAGERNLWIVGGGDLASQFYDAGLLDEIIVQIGSATLGKGKPLFPRQTLYPALKLQSVQQMGSGMAELRYQVQNPVQSDPVTCASA